MQIAEVQDLSPAGLCDAHGRAHWSFGVKCPVRATARCIECIYSSGGAADEEPSARNCRLSHGRDVARESEGPFELETRNLGGSQFGHGRGLKTGVGQVDTPAAPARRARQDIRTAVGSRKTSATPGKISAGIIQISTSRGAASAIREPGRSRFAEALARQEFG